MTSIRRFGCGLIVGAVVIALVRYAPGWVIGSLVAFVIGVILLMVAVEWVRVEWRVRKFQKEWELTRVSHWRQQPPARAWAILEHWDDEVAREALVNREAEVECLEPLKGRAEI